MDYRIEIAGIEKDFTLVERTYKEGLESALWNFDYKLLDIQTTGILNIPGIIYLEIREDNDKVIHKNGTLPSSNNSLSFKMDLTHARTDLQGKTKIGEIEIWGDLDSVYLNIWRKAGMTLFIQFLKTFLVSSAILIILNRILTQHLLKVRSHLLASVDLTKPYQPLRLNRSSQLNDELQSLEDSINHMISTSHKNFKQLADLNHSLEEQVRERSEVIAVQQNKLLLSAKLSSLGEMAGGIAHEINTPLTIISLLAEQTQVSDDKEKISEYQERIISTVNKIGKIISSLKFLVRDSVLEGIEKVSLDFLINETLALCSWKIDQSKVNLIIEPYQEVTIQCRAVQISLVLVNLIRNAIDAVENLPEKWIRISIQSDCDMVCIRVQDSGTGIPDDVVEKMFLPFYSTKSIGRGTGLGLSISYNIIANHQGSLSYNNESGHTEFIIKIPQVAESVAG